MIESTDFTDQALFEARAEGRIVAIGGLNIAPYLTDKTVGRIRWFYVDPDYRREGISTLV